MKDLAKKRWFVFVLGILFAVVLLLIFSLILYCNGYRIVYPEQFETSWDAVSGFAAWFGVAVSIVSVGASLAAVWAAIQVPKKIAEKQDAVSLFEKRFDCYNIIQKLLACGAYMANAKINKQVQTAFRIYLGQPEDIEKNEPKTVFALRLKQKEVIIVSGAFLFSVYNVEILQTLIDTGMALIFSVASTDKDSPTFPLSGEAIELKNQYCQLCKEFEEKYIEPMEKELALNKIK